MPVLELAGPDRILTTSRTDDKCIRLLQKHGMAVARVRFQRTDVAVQRELLVGSFKYDPIRISASEEGGIACSLYPFSRSSR